jgi:GT2 family glycosyltransferase
MKVAFICVNYNNSFHTINWVNSLLKYTNDDCLVIVDNSSQQEDLYILVDFIKSINLQLVSKIILVESSLNLGYFGGLNLGLSKLNKTEFDYILVGNNDLVFSENFRFELNKLNININIFVVSPNIINLNGYEQNPHVFKKFNFIKRLYYFFSFQNYFIFNFFVFVAYLKGKYIRKDNFLYKQKSHYIYMGYGACYLLTRNYFKYFNELPNSLFLMGEEALLSNQVFSKNGKILYAPTLIIKHIEHASISKLKSKFLFNRMKFAYIYHKENSKFINY